MANFPVPATIFDTSPTWLASQALAEFEKWLASTLQLPGAQAAQSLAISSGSIAPSAALVVVDTEGATAADDLTTISLANLHAGAIVAVTSTNSARVVTVKNGGSTNNIVTLTGTDYALHPGHWMMLRHDGSLWREVSLTVSKEAIENRLTGLITSHTHSHGSLRNKIINGNFDIWQRGTSHTSSGYGSADRWYSANSGTTKTMSKQGFTLGQTSVPGNPLYFCRHAVTSVAGASNYSTLQQRVEGVQTLSGLTITLSFWAKADASKSIAVDFQQNFGTGGSPSASVSAIGAIKFSVGTSWQKYTVTATLPSVSGKTLGSDGNDCLEVVIWFDAGSTWNSRTGSLGQQSGTFDIAQVQLEPGSVATDFEQRPIGLELQLCHRYFYNYEGGINGCQYADTNFMYIVPFPTRMRTTPAVTKTVSNGTFASENIGPCSWAGYYTGTSFGSVTAFTATAEL